MELTTDIIKALRDKTGVSVMQCKKALEEADGDLAKAEVILRKRSAASAEGKSGRTLGSGAIGTYVHDGQIGAMVLLSCETDFVARNPDFITLAREIAMHVSAMNPKYVATDDVSTEAREAATSVFQAEIAGKPEDMREKILEGKLSSYFSDQVLLDQSYIKDETKKIRDLINEAVQKFGERVEIGQISRFSARS